jgi:Bacterial TSP3 repeat
MKPLKTILRFLCLLVALTQILFGIVDNEPDGMSDLWEAQYGFSRFDDGTITPSQAPTADPDGDGVNNLAESIAGTNPNSSTGPLGTFKITMSPNPLLAGTFNLQFLQLTGKKYQLETSTDLQTWTPLGDPFIGTAAAVTLATPLPPAGTQKIFYRETVNDTDFDFDSLSSYEESIICSNPKNPDSDGDGVGDKTEYTNGSNPCSSADGGHPLPITPAQLPPGKLIKIRLFTSVILGPTYSQISPNGEFLTPYDVNVYKKHKTTGVETLVYTMNYSGVNPFVSNDIALPNLPDFVYTIQATIPDLSSSSLVQQFRDFSFVVNAAQLTGSEPFTVTPRFNPAVSLPLGAFGSVGFNHGYPANPHAIGLGAYRMVLSSLGVDEVISDQIMDNDANKLPTAAYGGQPNNPMVMATRTGNDARLRIRMNPFAPLASKLLVAVREVASGTIKGSTVPLLNPAPTPISFTAANGSLLHEVVSGQDTNGNGILETAEVKSVFEKTPRLNVNGNPYSGADTTFKFLDKIVVVTGPDFVAARNTTEGYSTLPGVTSFYPNYGALLNAFANGDSLIAGAATEFGIPINSSVGLDSTSGLALPLGVRWNASNEGSLHRIVYANGSDLSNKIRDSSAIRCMYGRLIWRYQAGIFAAATPTFSTVTINEVEDDEVDFSSILPSDAFLVFGKCKFSGTLQVSMRSFPGGFEVAQVNCIGSFTDLYDFQWPGPKFLGGLVDTKNCMITQTGHASLATAPKPDAGMIFYTKVNLITGFVSYSENF